MGAVERIGCRTTGARRLDHRARESLFRAQRRQSARGPDRLGGRLSNPKNPFATITVKEGENQLEPFSLK